MSKKLLLAKIDEIKGGHDFASLIAHMKWDEFVSTDEQAWAYIEAFLQYFCLNMLVDDGVIGIPAGVVDDTYHLFILNHTERYEDFCLRFFGKKIPHIHRTFYFTGECEGVDEVVRTTTSLLRLYEEALSPILAQWIAWVEHLASLDPERRERTRKVATIHQLLDGAREYLGRAEKLKALLASSQEDA